MEIKLPSGRVIGEGQPTYIIAEISSNWFTKSDCLYSIEKAKSCGADAVKFQMFSEVELYGMRSITDATNPKTCNLSIDELEARGSLRKSLPNQLPYDWIPELKDHADKVGIEFMVTGFSPKGYEYLNRFVNIHKVASAEMCHVRILETLRKLGKPVIMSTGAHHGDEIKHSLQLMAYGGLFRRYPPLEVILMYCVAAYPAKEVDFGRIQDLETMFGLPVGYSDHTFSLDVPRMAVEDGACVIEKHVSFIQGETPDSGHSTDEAGFREIIQGIRIFDGILSDSKRKKRDSTNSRIIHYTEEENPMVAQHNRRIIAVKDIRAGERLIEGQNFGIYRSLKDESHAAHAFLVDKIDGAFSKVDIKAGDGIGPKDFTLC